MWIFISLIDFMDPHKIEMIENIFHESKKQTKDKDQKMTVEIKISEK